MFKQYCVEFPDTLHSGFLQRLTFISVNNMLLIHFPEIMSLPQAKHRVEVNDSPAKYRIKLCAALNPSTVVKSVNCSQSCT